MTTDIKQVMNRLKNLKEFEVVIDMPDEFFFNGTIPFDIKMDRNQVATVIVIAETQQEADNKVADFFEVI